LNNPVVARLVGASPLTMVSNLSAWPIRTNSTCRASSLRRELRGGSGSTSLNARLFNIACEKSVYVTIFSIRPYTYYECLWMIVCDNHYDFRGTIYNVLYFSTRFLTIQRASSNTYFVLVITIKYV